MEWQSKIILHIQSIKIFIIVASIYVLNLCGNFKRLDNLDTKLEVGCGGNIKFWIDAWSGDYLVVLIRNSLSTTNELDEQFRTRVKFLKGVIIW